LFSDFEIEKQKLSEKYQPPTIKGFEWQLLGYIEENWRHDQNRGLENKITKKLCTPVVNWISALKFIRRQRLKESLETRNEQEQPNKIGKKKRIKNKQINLINEVGV
jgi:hypothetical protein